MTPSTPIRMLAFGLLLGLAASSYSDTPKQRLALKGYDPVAYFTVGKPVQGDPAVALDWDESRYHFSTARHRDLFASDPERYAPRFSGFCTSAVLRGKRYETDPDLWAIIDGRLYLFAGREGKARFEANPEVERAEAAWGQIGR